MERFYLEEPSLKRKDAAIDYINEHIDYGSNINGVGGLDRILNEGGSYEEWLEKVTKEQSKKYAESIGKVPANTYFTIRESDNKIIGMVNIRHYLNDYLRKFGGHIGYGIRPTERRKGYNKINLYLGLIEAKKIGLDKVMLDCDVENLGSSKTMEALGGKLERTEIDPYDGILTSVYWINVDESLEKYKDEYVNSIDKSYKNSTYEMIKRK